jgi:hypothetical protein
MFEKILKWYDQGLWAREMVLKAFEKKVLTFEEIEQIIDIEEGVN